ncbi:MAG: flagellar assembly protein FliX [Proteobacteria bacterium]|nr:flagellar assembly protein FliX [Pseudomonadota bacterium]
MEIRSTSRVGSSSVRRTSGSTASSDSAFTVSTTTEQPRAQTVASSGAIASVESILTLQGLDDSTSGRSRGLAHGEHLLDMLDEVRDGLLAGGIPRATLNRLANAVSQRQEGFSDPKLQNVLDEIELRARVELAKLEQSDQAAAS